MQIKGLQKLTLLDYPGLVACTVFLNGCNFRCPFCHNADLVLHGAEESEMSISMQELESFLKKRQGVLEGVCVSGGEPLIHPQVEVLLQSIKQLGYKVKVDTNGSFPQRLKQLVDRELVDYVAMDIKNAPEKYSQSVGLKNFDLSPVQESVDFLLSGNIDYEFRTTVVKELHEKEDFISIGKWITGAKRYFLQNFVESESIIQNGLHSYEKQELEGFQNLLKLTVPNTKIRGI